MSQSQAKRDHNRIVSMNSTKQENSSLLDKLNVLIDERHKKGKYLKTGIEPKKESRNSSQESKKPSSVQKKAKSRQSSEDTRKSTSLQKRYQSNQAQQNPAQARARPDEPTNSTSLKKERVEDRLLKHLELREKMLRDKQKALDLELRRPVDPRLKISTGSGLHSKPHVKAKQVAASPPRKKSPTKAAAAQPVQQVAPARHSTPSPPKAAVVSQTKQASPGQKRLAAGVRKQGQFPASLQTSVNGPASSAQPNARVNQSTNTTAGQPGRLYSPAPAPQRVGGTHRPKLSPEARKLAATRVSASIPKSIIADLNERARRAAAQTPPKVVFAKKNPALQPVPRRRASPHNPSEANTKFGLSDRDSEDSLERPGKPVPRLLDSLDSSASKKPAPTTPEAAPRQPARADPRVSAPQPRGRHSELPHGPKVLAGGPAPAGPGPLRSAFEKPEEQLIQQVSTEDRLGVSESLKSSLADEDFIHLETLSKNGLFSGKDDQEEDEEELDPPDAPEPEADLRARLKGIFEKNQRLQLQAQGLQPSREPKPSTTLATMTYMPKNR